MGYGTLTDAKVEEISIPDEEREDAPPDWLEGGPKIGVLPGAAPTASEEAGATETGELVTDLVASIHDKLAESTGYGGWRLTENDVRLWQKVLKFLLRRLPGKDWPIAIAVVSLMISESMKFVGYMKFRRENAISTPTRAPTGAEA